MIKVQDYATQVVGAALRHDFGIPLGVIGRNVQFIDEIFEESDSSDLKDTIKKEMTELSGDIAVIEAELNVEFRGFGKQIGRLGDFEREREYARLRTTLLPKMETLVEKSQRLFTYSRSTLDEDVIRYAGQALSAARRTIKMFSGLVHFVRIGDIGRELFVDTDITHLVERNIATVRIGRLGNYLDLKPRLEGTLEFQCIPSHIDQLVQNYVSNALKFASLSKSPEVTIRLAESSYGGLSIKYGGPLKKFAGRGKWGEIVVEDNGPGVDKEISNSLFNLYSQRRPDRLEYQSTGVGLAVCQLVAHIHGGFVFFRRENELTKFIGLFPCVFDNQIENTTALKQ